ncbi:hypothetical protein [Weissella halotolerans]|uniref:DNA-directed RNA polymerase beta subunit n=1 Tax=Weissella halotolerans DSM 20190 TaxID=1123500 RepID=A0A0R2FYH6_9LACO|nr:hypothetical protein [Weissella halotolerans]KRN33521.1 hypothetical protein IV68_GL000325 [Weissella halotolerans DSM 20190]
MVSKDKDRRIAIERAKHFFERDYQDRGMVKWQGYYLSDHTEDVQAYSAKRQASLTTPLMPEMEIGQVASLLFKAYKNKLVVLYQEKTQDIQGTVPPLQVSKVLGYVDDKIVFERNRQVSLDSIQWCDLN